MEPEPLKLPGRLSRIKAWVKKHPRRSYAIIGVSVVLLGGFITTAALLLQPKAEPRAAVKKVAAKPKPKPIYYSLLTGETVPDEISVTQPVTAIMIENSPDARPQSGLKKAEIVYEAIAEGGITRFLALYQQNKPELIGPVRSLRMYYVDWLTPYNASIAHIGGSQKALKTVRSGSYRDIDQFFNANYYWRATDRYAPHNVYTSFSKLAELNTKKGYASSNPLPFARADDAKKLPKQDAKQVNLTISGPIYNSSYVYDPATKLYARSQAGAPHLDRESGQIKARVVIALRVKMTTVLEDGYRQSIVTTGSGEARIFQNGHVQAAVWHKESAAKQLRFTDTAGKPLALARGTTWISAIPLTGGNVTWQ